jgi:hypothetical protein
MITRKSIKNALKKKYDCVCDLFCISYSLCIIQHDVFNEMKVELSLGLNKYHSMKAYG